MLRLVLPSPALALVTAMVRCSAETICIRGADAVEAVDGGEGLVMGGGARHDGGRQAMSLPSTVWLTSSEYPAAPVDEADEKGDAETREPPAPPPRTVYSLRGSTLGEVGCELGPDDLDAADSLFDLGFDVDLVEGAWWPR